MRQVQQVQQGPMRQDEQEKGVDGVGQCESASVAAAACPCAPGVLCVLTTTVLTTAELTCLHNLRTACGVVCSLQGYCAGLSRRCSTLTRARPHAVGVHHPAAGQHKHGGVLQAALLVAGMEEPERLQHWLHYCCHLLLDGREVSHLVEALVHHATRQQVGHDHKQDCLSVHDCAAGLDLLLLG